MASSTQEQQQFRHIVRVGNADLPGEEQIRWALTKIKGVGINYADALCAATRIVRTAKAGFLVDAQVAALNDALGKPAVHGIPPWLFNHRQESETGRDVHHTGGTLTFMQENDIKLMKKVRSYKGMRHAKGLPVRGQRTRSNFRKSKGKVVGVTKKKLAAASAAAGGKESKKEAKK